MLRQSSSRNQRSKKLRPSHSLQAFLLVAVGVWIVYQLTRSYGNQRIVAVEADGNDGESARRRLGRKGLVEFAAGQASVDGIAGVGGGSDADSSEDALSKAGGDGDEEDQGTDEDGGVDSDEDDGLAADDEDDDDRDLQSQNGSGEDEPKTAQGQIQTGLNTSNAPPVNASDTVQDGVAVVLLANATGRAADGTDLTLSGSALKNTSSVDLSSLHAGGTAGGGGVPNGFAVGSLPIKRRAEAEARPADTNGQFLQGVRLSRSTSCSSIRCPVRVLSAARD